MLNGFFLFWMDALQLRKGKKIWYKTFYLYKIFIIPSVILMIIFWYQINKYIYKSNLLLFFSITSCIFLIIYLFALGFEGKIYRFMREIGIFVFFIWCMPSIIEGLKIKQVCDNKIKSKFFN